MIGIGVSPVTLAVLAGARGWPPPTLLTTLHPTGSPIVQYWTHPLGTCTFDDSTAAALQDGNDATYAFVKSVSTGYGSQTIRIIRWPFTTCPDYAHLDHLLLRLRAKMIQVGTASKIYVGAITSAGKSGDPPTITPGASFAWQDYLFAQAWVGGVWVPWTTALVNALSFGYDTDQYVNSPTGYSLEYDFAELDLQVWGTA
jgi:hypothetical protein